MPAGNMVLPTTCLPGYSWLSWPPSPGGKIQQKISAIPVDTDPLIFKTGNFIPEHVDPHGIDSGAYWPPDLEAHCYFINAQ